MDLYTKQKVYILLIHIHIIHKWRITKMNENKCLRCDYQWQSRLKRKPKVCPKCKSYFWDKERVDEE